MEAGNQSAEARNSCNSDAEIVIDNLTFLKTNGVQLSWKIINRSKKAIFVYSTFLENRRAAAWIERRDGVLEAHTSLPTKLNMTAYSYPEATFIKIEPNNTESGTFIDTEPTVRIHKSTKIVFTIAYGSDIEGVKEALRQHFYHGSGHPANPIVDWQCISMSNVIAIP